MTPLSTLPAFAGEGQWHAVATVPSPTSDLYITWFRPDGAHAPVTVGAALLPQNADRFSLVAGTREPVPGLASPSGYAVPATASPSLVATFNGGFKVRDSPGGWYLNGTSPVALHDGIGSFVIDDTGRATVGSWGRDVSMSTHIVAVRQNLPLIVDGGRPVDGLDANVHGRFGSVRSQFEYTWRSGAGVDAGGNLIYLAGQHLTLLTLGKALAQAGVVRGMELDIHSHMVLFNIEQHSRTTLRPVHLLKSMDEPVTRYLAADQRDFFYVTAR